MHKWGILGAGSIVRRWIRGARQVEDLQLCMIGSRTTQSAEKAAQELDIPAFGTYQEVVENPEIEICYVAVPHPYHRELAELAMNHGKSVLVEKPGAVSAADWKAMCECAERNGVFLMEAVWTRFFPAVKTLQGLFTPEALGPLKAVNCAFSYYMPDFFASKRNLNPELAGGGLLDVGVYCLHLCDMVFHAAPEQLTGMASINTDQNQFGVDEQAMILAQYPGQALASMACGVRTAMPDTAYLYAANASVEIPTFYKPTELRILRSKGREKETEVLRFPVEQKDGCAPDEGFRYELEHVHRCLEKGLKQSPEVSWEVTARVLAACDELRAQWGLKYPFETA